MQALTGTIEQISELNGYINNGHMIEFDYDDNGVLCTAIENINNPNFVQVKGKLEKLTTVNYAPILIQNRTL